MARRPRTFTKEVEIEIDLSDVIEFINHYASDEELKEIAEEVDTIHQKVIGPVLFEDRGLEGGLVREEKLELLSAAYRKFSLAELEQRLGTKFDLL